MLLCKTVCILYSHLSQISIKTWLIQSTDKSTVLMGKWLIGLHITIPNNSAQSMRWVCIWCLVGRVDFGTAHMWMSSAVCHVFSCVPWCHRVLWSLWRSAEVGPPLVDQAWSGSAWLGDFSVLLAAHTVCFHFIPIVTQALRHCCNIFGL